MTEPPRGLKHQVPKKSRDYCRKFAIFFRLFFDLINFTKTVKGGGRILWRRSMGGWPTLRGLRRAGVLQSFRPRTAEE